MSCVALPGKFAEYNSINDNDQISPDGCFAFQIRRKLAYWHLSMQTNFSSVHLQRLVISASLSQVGVRAQKAVVGSSVDC
jgi:hypothetical protein